MSFGSRPLAPADAVLLERAHDERGLREAERAPRPRDAVGRAQRERLDVDPDRDAVHLLRRHPGLEHELLHLPVRHLDAVDLLVPPAHRVEARVELGHSWRARPAVEVREAQVVPATLEVVQQERELALVEDRLAARRR